MSGNRQRVGGLEWAFLTGVLGLGLAICTCASSREPARATAVSAEPAASPDDEGARLRERHGLARLEAEELVGRLYRSAVAYAYGPGMPSGPDGSAGPTLPASCPLTPAASCCEQPDGRCVTDRSVWETPLWEALNFYTTEPHLLRYELVSGPSGFTARAVGDLDCDGVLSTFERAGELDSNGDVVETLALRETNPGE